MELIRRLGRAAMMLGRDGRTTITEVSATH